jgi:hypothetical protein
VSTLLHAFVYNFTTFAECIGTDQTANKVGNKKNAATTVSNTQSKVEAEWISALQNSTENDQVQIETWY